MSAVLSFFNQGWVGVLVGAIGIAVALYTIFRRTKGRLLYQQASIRLLDPRRNSLLNNVSVLYGDKKVPRISLTHIAIWNNGRSAVRSTDVSEHRPISLQLVGEGEILEASVPVKIAEENAPVVTIGTERQSLSLNFSFLNPGDGIIVRMIHTSEKSNVLVSGKLIDLPEIHNAGQLGLTSYRSGASTSAIIIRRSRLVVGLYLLVSGILFVVLGTVFKEDMASVDQRLFAFSQTYGWLLGLAMGIPMILGSFLLLTSRRAPPSALISGLSNSVEPAGV
jgi:hypothetical protein